MIPKKVINKFDEFKNYLQGLGLDVSAIQDRDMLLTTFMHKSFAADYPQDIPFNERLEFVGDAILGAIVAKKLFAEYDLPESKLTLYKIGLIKKENLAAVGKDLLLHKMILLGKGEDKSGGRHKEAIIEDALEALIGYIYLDLGIQQVENFIDQHVYSKLETNSFGTKSPKSLLQELVQKLYKELPEYKEYEYEKDSSGDVTKYRSEVFVQGQKKGEGIASNKKLAQRAAASSAYDKLSVMENQFGI